MLKKILRKFALYLKDILDQDLIDNCHANITIANNVKFYTEAEVINLQNNKSKIQINSGTHVRGMLLIFSNKGEINIGSYCYIGQNTRIWSASRITIGNNVLISHGVNIMDNDSHPLDSKE